MEAHLERRRQFMADIQEFERLLRDKSAERDQHNRMVPHPLGDAFGRETPQWHLNEMNLLLEEINLRRTEQGKPPVDFETLANQEIVARGHIDYAQKLALYCAELLRK